jgi:hypothetical protein
MNSAAARPLVPDDLKPSSLSLPRAAYMAALAAARGVNAADLCRSMFPHDRSAAAFLERSATTGGSTSGWGADLVSRSVAAWLGSLAPASAAAELIRRGVVLSLVPGGQLSVPGRSAPPMAAPWVSEAAPTPVRSYSLNSATLSPCKLGAICVLSRELMLSSAASDVIEQLLVEDASAGLDAAYLSADDGTTPGHHRGLLAGLVAGAGSASMSDDLSKLASAVMAGGSGGDVLFVCSPDRCASARVRIAVTSSAVLPILPSLAVPPDRVVCVDVQSLVHATSGDVEITGAVDAVLHLDTNPVNIGSAGSPPTVASPGQSLFQTAQVGTRVLVDIAFAIRRSGAVAYADGCSW